jgi:hypothetical protein
MNRDNEMSLEVIEVQTIGDRLIVAGQLLSGEVESGMMLESDTNARYEVTGVGFVSPEGHSAGRRALTLVQIDEADLAIGSTLHLVSTPPE